MDQCELITALDVFQKTADRRHPQLSTHYNGPGVIAPRHLKISLPGACSVFLAIHGCCCTAGSSIVGSPNCFSWQMAQETWSLLSSASVLLVLRQHQIGRPFTHIVGCLAPWPPSPQLCTVPGLGFCENPDQGCSILVSG